MSICNYSGQIVRRDTPLLPEEGWTRHKADAAKPPLKERTGWSLTSHISECVLNTACERRRFLMAAPYRACAGSARLLMAAPYRACAGSARLLMAAPYRLMFRAIALTLRAGLRGLRPPLDGCALLLDVSRYRAH